jgi:hypothetical protein
MMHGMSAIVVKLPVRPGPHVNAIPARPQPARVIELATYRRPRRARSARPPRVRPPRPDFGDDDGEGGWEAGAHDVIDAAEALLRAGQREDVLEFCARAAECLGRNAAEIGDAGAVVGLTSRIGALRARAGGG